MDGVREGFRAVVGGASGIGQAGSIVQDLQSVIPASTVGIAAAGIVLTGSAVVAGYEAIESYKTNAIKSIDQFHTDVANNTVTVFIPKSGLSSGDTFMLEFIKAIQGGKGTKGYLFQYSGIRLDAQKRNNIDGTYYSIISMASLPLGAGFGHYQGDDRCLDKARQGSDFYLGSELPFFLDRVNNYPNYGFFNKQEFNFKPDHTTRRLNRTRFVLMVLGNILLMLQHPPNVKDDDGADVIISDELAIAMCAQLDRMLDSIVLGREPFAYIDRLYPYPKEGLHTEISSPPYVRDFLNSFRQEVFALKKGYQSKLIHHLNLGELTGQIRGLLQTINSTVGHLLYLDSKQAHNNHLAYLINDLSRVMTAYPTWQQGLKKYYSGKRSYPKVSGLNKFPTTVIDVVGLFALSTDRAGIISALIESKNTNVADRLQRINEFFLLPLEPLLDPVGRQGGKNMKKSQSGETRASFDAAHVFFMNFLALIIESFPSFIQESFDSTAGVTSIQDQITAINDNHFVSEASPLFSWNILNNLELSSAKELESKSVSGVKETPRTLERFKAMLRAHYELLTALRILEPLEQLLSKNEFLLLNRQVQLILIKALETLKSKQEKLKNKVEVLSNTVEEDTQSNPKRKYYLAHILEVDNGFSYWSGALSDSIEQTLKLLTSSHFTQDEERELHSAIDSVATEAAKIYGVHQDFVEDHEKIISMVQNALQGGSRLVMAQASANILSAAMDDSVIESSDEQGLHSSATLPLNTVSVGTSTIESLPVTAVFQMKMMCMILAAVSAFMIVAGLILLLSMTFGVGYLSLMSVMTAHHVPLLSMMGGYSIAAGSAGLGVSYMGSLFFTSQQTPIEENGNQMLQELGVTTNV